MIPSKLPRCTSSVKYLNLLSLDGLNLRQGTSDRVRHHDNGMHMTHEPRGSARTATPGFKDTFKIEASLQTWRLCARWIIESFPWLFPADLVTLFTVQSLLKVSSTVFVDLAPTLTRTMLYEPRNFFESFVKEQDGGANDSR